MSFRDMGTWVCLLSLLFLVGAVHGGARDRHKSHRNGTRVLSRLMYNLGAEKKSEFIKRKICIGTNVKWSVSSNREHHYRNLKNRFTNCTYVDGNLELTWIQNASLDLNFLQYIQEVTGYVLISHVDLKRVVLPRLQIIRGRTLLKMKNYKDEFSLIVTTSKMFSLELPALREVLNGSVGFFNNYNLCHVKTINWKDIISDIIGKQVLIYDFDYPERDCPPCHKNCVAGCWGEGEENCQRFSKENCSPQCYQGRCFGTKPRECCHLFCAGGCTGPKQNDCIACKNFYDDGVCTQECPPMQIYNPKTYSWQPNPNGKYAYGETCVKNCPEHLLKDNGACVRVCPSNKKAVNGECVLCNGPCPKTCTGDVQINSGNIDSFKGCTIIEGFIHILESSFTGYQHFYPNLTFGDHFSSMHPDRLEVFSILKEITGFLDIQADHPHFKNLSYFRNLEVIGGRTLYNMFSSLYIIKTSLESLELRSLKRINYGAVIILANRNLCFAEEIDWKKIRKSSKHQFLLQHNRDLKICKSAGLTCDKQCTRDGCWGSGPEQCLACSQYAFGDTCLQNCSVIPGMYDSGNNTCNYCHEECNSSCSGPGPECCNTCKNLRDGLYCVSKCSITKYEENGECKLCHVNCVDGCTGPQNTVGLRGCNSCEKAIMNENATVDVCLHKNEPCPDGYFYEWMGRPQVKENLKPLAICRKCHSKCKKCTGYGFHVSVCQQCTNYIKGEQCEDECLADHYPDNENQQCIPCDKQCRGCTGPGPKNCHYCEHYKIFTTDEMSVNDSFMCVASCPPEYPHKIFSQNSSSPYCSTERPAPILSSLDSQNTLVLYGSIIGSVVLVVISVGVVFIYHYYIKMKVNDVTTKITRTLDGVEDDEPLGPTNVLPNLAKLRIIKEAEMRRGEILGYGAFGIVYKGVWVPEGENQTIPVAIKVLRKDTGANTSKEFLDEAYIMATVDHPNLLQLLAVCMTSQMMLITQLMPNGCLLDFVRNNHNKINSKLLLTWCTQIARGMAYLEAKRLVHRDLAARNVLVQTLACVKITDFGLAKHLEVNEEEYKDAGGKMPIKWLALECILHHIYTHKSDVWAFGVTVWELLTFGERPYNSVQANDVPNLLEKGKRLPQPDICTIDVYMIMVKCWMLDAESRPSFKELAEEFAKMTRDPSRYLVIKGNTLVRTHNIPHDDGKDIARIISSSIECSNGPIADEYMGARVRTSKSVTGLTSLSTSSPSTHNRFWNLGSRVTSDGTCAPQNQENWNRERLHYIKSHNLDPNSIQISNNSVDEDDNLMPPSQQTLASSPYEVVGHEKNSETNCNTGFYSYPEFGETDIDNPEYLMVNEPPSEILGIPTVSKLVQSSGSFGNTNKNSSLPQKILEDESDREYYNDFDRLLPPQQTQTSSPYVVVGYEKNSETNCNTEFHSYPKFGETDIDNIEYLMANEPLSQTLGIPTVSKLVTSSGSFGNKNKNSSLLQTILEDESDHEYYNDFDRLQREL